jgi:hypothetical protein
MVMMMLMTKTTTLTTTTTNPPCHPFFMGCGSPFHCDQSGLQRVTQLRSQHRKRLSYCSISKHQPNAKHQHNRHKTAAAAAAAPALERLAACPHIPHGCVAASRQLVVAQDEGEQWAAAADGDGVAPEPYVHVIGVTKTLAALACHKLIWHSIGPLNWGMRFNKEGWAAACATKERVRKKRWKKLVLQYSRQLV